MAATSTEKPARERFFPVSDYDLAATLNSGQAFRWHKTGDAWEGVIGRRWVRLSGPTDGIRATVVEPVADWSWLVDYLQLDVPFAEVLAVFPGDEPLRGAVKECPGLRLLRQEVWECLASFILSSTKQIIQIRQIVGRLCERFGERVAVPAGVGSAWSFPGAGRLAAVSEDELRRCGMGFRAPYLRESARMVAAGEIKLGELPGLSLDAARAELLRLPGVGRKIADCVLLFAGGQPAAFPVDTWMLKTLRQLYFDGREVSPGEVIRFSENYFGPQAGYAQQYLFHAARQRAGKVEAGPPGVRH
jgi:N-glycosylase/DNA lyase